MRMLLALVVLAGPALADAPVPAQERQTLEQFGTSNPTCREWTDGCAVCSRQEDKSVGCSLPGISCQPGKLSCSQPPPDKNAKP